MIPALWLLPAACTFAACTLVDTTTSGFGSSIGTENIDSREVAGLTLNCDSEYRIALDVGIHYTGSRRLSDGAGHFVNYALWTDAGGTVPWGDNGLAGTYPANPLTSTGNGTNVFHPIYGTASTAGTTHAWLYTDTVHVTIAYPPYSPADKLETDLVLEVTIIGTCTLDSSGVTGFGAWPSDAADITGVALGIITVTCISGTNYALGIDAGLHWNATLAGKRHLANGSSYIPYILWTDANRTTEWGDTGLTEIENTYVETHPAPVQVSVGTGNLQTFFLWGDALIQGVGVAGNYNDTVIVTVVWP
jgi:spore coat protein U-like protein